MNKKVCLNCGCECWGSTVYCPACGKDKFEPVGAYKPKEEVKPTVNSFIPKPTQPVKPQVTQQIIVSTDEKEECFGLAILLGFLLGPFGILTVAIMTSSKPYVIKAVKQGLIGWALNFFVSAILSVILFAALLP